MPSRVLDVHDIKRAGVLVSVCDDADTTDVVTSRDHDQISYRSTLTSSECLCNVIWLTCSPGLTNVVHG